MNEDILVNLFTYKKKKLRVGIKCLRKKSGNKISGIFLTKWQNSGTVIFARILYFQGSEKKLLNFVWQHKGLKNLCSFLWMLYG